MSNIPLKCLIGAFAVVSITGCDATADRDAPPTGWNARKKADKVDVANKGFCQKSKGGHTICIKKENISCESYPFNNDGVSTWTTCGAAGIATDLTGKANHWTTGGYGHGFCLKNGKRRNEYDRFVDSTADSITCRAAIHFGKI